MRGLGVVGAVLLLAGCAPTPPRVYPLLLGSALPGDPAPPPINRPLTGFGDLTFGMSQYDAAHLGYAPDPDNGGASLLGNPKIDGMTFLETVNFDGTPAQLSSISLASDGQNLGASGDITCPSAQQFFNDLSAKYGTEQTAVDDSLGPGYRKNSYTWTFEDGRTIELDDWQGQCPLIIYSEAEAPQKTPGL